MKEKTKLVFLIIACILAVIIMSIWMWDDMMPDFSESWIDRYDRSYGR